MSLNQLLTFPFVFAVLASVATSQQTATLSASKDNTLYENATGSLSNGVGTGIFVGRNNGNYSTVIYRRGLLAFDTSFIPAGSTITSAELRLVLVAANGSVPVSLHPALADWGESNSLASIGGGGGGPAQPGDATWLHTFSPGSLWTNPGGDYVATASGTSTASGSAGTLVTWTTNAQLVSDVQAWVDTPASNFGWLLKAPEIGVTNATKFSSRESSSPPELVVTYTPPATAASVTPTGTGTIVTTGGSPFTLATNGLPSIGNASFAVTLTGGYGSGQSLLYTAPALAAAPIPLPWPNRFLYLEPFSLMALMAAGATPVGPVSLDAVGSATFNAAIPNDPSLAGYTVHVQADSTLGGAFATSNAITLVLN